jgi:hypothetical protein
MNEASAYPRPGRPRAIMVWTDGEDLLVYFNNDPGGAATVDAVVFADADADADADAVRRTGRTTTRVPTADEASGLARCEP